MKAFLFLTALLVVSAFADDKKAADGEKKHNKRGIASLGYGYSPYAYGGTYGAYNGLGYSGYGHAAYGHAAYPAVGHAAYAAPAYAAHAHPIAQTTYVQPHTHTHSVQTVAKPVIVEKPVVVEKIVEKTVAVPHPVPVVKYVPQPYPVVKHVAVPAPYPVEKKIAVPYPVVKHVPYVVEKHVAPVVHSAPIYATPAPVYASPAPIYDSHHSGYHGGYGYHAPSVHIGTPSTYGLEHLHHH